MPTLVAVSGTTGSPSTQPNASITLSPDSQIAGSTNQVIPHAEAAILVITSMRLVNAPRLLYRVSMDAQLFQTTEPPVLNALTEDALPQLQLSLLLLLLLFLLHLILLGSIATNSCSTMSTNRTIQHAFSANPDTYSRREIAKHYRLVKMQSIFRLAQLFQRRAIGVWVLLRSMTIPITPV